MFRLKYTFRMGYIFLIIIEEFDRNGRVKSKKSSKIFGKQSEANDSCRKTIRDRIRSDDVAGSNINLHGTINYTVLRPKIYTGVVVRVVLTAPHYLDINYPFRQESYFSFVTLFCPKKISV